MDESFVSGLHAAKIVLLGAILRQLDAPSIFTPVLIVAGDAAKRSLYRICHRCQTEDGDYTLRKRLRDQGHARGVAVLSADRKSAINKLSQAALRKAVQQRLRERRPLATPRNSFRPSNR